MHGLNMYDYSARYMDPAIGRFTTVDPLAEFHFSNSPYAYVLNNPLKYIDINGMDTTYVNPQGETIVTIPGGEDISISVMDDIVFEVDTKQGNKDSYISDAATMVRQGRNKSKEYSDISGTAGAASALMTMKGGYYVFYSKDGIIEGRYYSNKSIFKGKAKFRRVPIDLKSTGNIIGKMAGLASAGLITYDIVDTQQIKASHLINGTMTGISMTGWGAPIAALWFILDTGTGLITGASISDRIDDAVGGPIIEW